MLNLFQQTPSTETLTLIGLFVGIAGIVFGIWQSRKTARLKVIFNTRVRSMFQHAKKIEVAAQRKDSQKNLHTLVAALKDEIILMDINNRNLTKEAIVNLKKQKVLSDVDVEDYLKLLGD